jgi:Flp pilus assembly protein TadG
MRAAGAARRLLPRRYTPAQSSVEFAGAAIVLIILMFSIMEMALAVLAYNTISFAAAEGARYGSALPDASQNSSIGTPAVQAIVQAQAPSLGLTTADIVVTWPTDTVLNNGRLDVSVQVNYSFMVSIPRMPWRSLASQPASVTLPLTSTAEMMCSQ